MYKSRSSECNAIFPSSLPHQAPVVQTLDSAIHWINHYPLDNSIGFASVYPLDSDLSGGQRYPSFEQLGPGDYFLFLTRQGQRSFPNIFFLVDVARNYI